MIKIAFFDSKPYDQRFFNQINEHHQFQIRYFKDHLTVDSASLAKGYDVVCAFVNDDLSKDVIDILYQNGTRLIALRCAGYNNVDFKAAYNKIHVVRVPAYSPYAVAEHTFALILALNRKIHKAYHRTRESNFSINGLVGFDLNQKVIGVIGTGKIGQVFIKIAKGFGMNVLAYDPYPNQEMAKSLQYTYVDLNTIYEKADIISLHCPLSKETYHLIDEHSFQKMKSGVMLINTSRGALIDTVALIDALKTRKVGAAGLDVYEEEEKYFFEDFSQEIVDDDILARLIMFNNVLITSHQAFLTEEALGNIADTTLASIDCFYKNEPLAHEICYQCGKAPSNCQRSDKGKCF